MNYCLAGRFLDVPGEATAQGMVWFNARVLRKRPMTLPVRHLSVIQNWDCHVSGSCCKEYLVTLTDEERKRIEAQGWEKDNQLGGLPPFRKKGPWWRRRYALNNREDGSCVFLSKEGRCRIHEKFGYETKPLPCRLFPFILVPAGDHWRVGIRFACPSAAWSRGRAMTGHDAALKDFAAELAQQAGIDKQLLMDSRRRPRLEHGQPVEWPDALRVVNVLLDILRNRQDRMDRRLRKCLALAELCRQARFDLVRGRRFEEFLNVVAASLDDGTPGMAAMPAPNWVGRILFRQTVALFTRKDHGPDQGVSRKGRLALLAAALRFASGRGPIPRMHSRIPTNTFEQVEAAASRMTAEVEETLERYYTVKVESLQFFGPTNFKLPLWRGLESLALTFPIIMWTSRTMHDHSPEDAVKRALTIVDDHFGFNPVLGSLRQRISLRMLAVTGQLKNLIAWYSR